MTTQRIRSRSTDKRFEGLTAFELLDEPEWRPKPEGDVGFVRRCFDETAQRPVRDVLDVGCGRGALLVPLAEQGYSVVGLDVNEADLERCRAALEARGAEAELVHGDMEALDAEDRYDAVLAIDSVPNYLLDDERIRALFVRCRRALRPGGVLILDIWNMLAQWTILDRPLVREKETADGRAVLREHFHVDSLRGRMHVRLRATVESANGTTEIDHEEVLRITTPAEMRMLLRSAGFESIACHAHHEDAGEPADNPEGLWFVALR